MSEQAASVRAEPAEARQPKTHPEPASQPAKEPVAASFGGLSGLLRMDDGRSGGFKRSITRHMLQLQASRGNQHVQRVMRSSKGEALGSATQSSQDVRRSPGPTDVNEQAVARSPEGLVVESRAEPGQIQRDEATTAITLTLGEPQNGTYTVDGADLEAAGNQMNRRGEWGQGGARNIVATPGAANADGILTSITITAVLFTTLPIWSRLASKPERVRNEWNRMLGALRGHEDHHVSIARTHLEELRTSLVGTSEAAFQSVWRGKMTALQAAQAAYDTSTTNGQTEGVMLDLNAEVEEEAAEAETVGIPE